MPDDVDKMFEDFFGYKTEDRPRTIQPKKRPDKGLLTLADEVEGETPETPEAPKGTIEDAAQAVAEALDGHLAKPRARRAVQIKFWRPVIAEALGFKRVVDKRLDEVIAKGIELHLFALDESGDFPFLVPSVHEDPSDTEESEEDEETEPVVSTPLPTRPPPSPHGWEPPEDWDPPGYLPCGHWDFQSVPLPRGEADKSGVPRGPTTTIVRVRSVEDCHYCKVGRPGHPQQQQEGYKTPVPEAMRRTPEKEASMGFPGYCCDEDGYYIGGIANNCRHANPKGPWCVVHGGSKKK